MTTYSLILLLETGPEILWTYPTLMVQDAIAKAEAGR